MFQADTGKVMARLQAEASNPHADVVISASWDSAQDLDKRGWLLAYESPNADKVAGQIQGSRPMSRKACRRLSIVWNTKSGTPRPTEWMRPDQAGLQG